MWLHSTCSWALLCCRWQLLLEGDREKTVSYSILTSPNLSLSPPDKRAGLFFTIPDLLAVVEALECCLKTL